MSVFSWVNETYEANRIGNDDDQRLFLLIVESLSEEQREIWLKECDIANALDKKYGFMNVTPEMYEKAFAEAGLD